jgi:type II secretory pathway predicted ATPase ExeA
MLLRHFGLRKLPFGSTPDPHFLFTQGMHAEALAQLRRGFANNARLQTLITTVGLGKTTILYSYKEFVDPLARCIFICNTFLNSTDLLVAISTKLAPTEPIPASISDLRITVDRILRTLHAAGGRLVIILDEAQDLDSSAIAELGALLQRAPASVSVVLAGQPELQEKLRHPAMAAWRSVKPLTLAPFEAVEVVRYVQFQLLVAGHKGQDIFTPDALAQISEQSAGIPRIINQLCSDALMKAFTLGKTVIDRQLLDGPIDYTEIARSLDNVINMESVFTSPVIKQGPTQAAPPPTAPSQTPAPPATVRAQTPVPPPHDPGANDPFAAAIRSWLLNRATIWTGTAGEILSGLREVENSAFAYMNSKEFSRKLEASLPTLESHGIHTEVRANPNGPRMISLRLTSAPHDAAVPSAEAQRAAG